MKGPNKTKRLKAQRGSADLTLVKFSSLEAPTSTQHDDECASSHGLDSGGSFHLGTKRSSRFQLILLLNIWSCFANVPSKFSFCLGGEGAASWTIGHERGKTFPACPILVSYASDSIIFHIIYLISKPTLDSHIDVAFRGSGFQICFSFSLKKKKEKEIGISLQMMASFACGSDLTQL